jgi:lysozyme
LRRRLLALAAALVAAVPSASAAPSAPAARSTPAASFVPGIDVSHWRGWIQWPRVARGGYRFAFAEATNGFKADWTYARNRRGAKAAGIAFGAFHLARPGGATPQAVLADALAEADFFVSVAQPQTGELAPVLDLEHTGGLSPASLRAWTTAWLSEVQLHVGIRPTIYSSPTFWRSALSDANLFALGGSRLWIAHWTRGRAPRVPASNWGSTGWTFWQWTDCSHVPGIRGCVDGDRFRGPRVAPALMAPPPVAIEAPTIAGVPQTGQALRAAPGSWDAEPAPKLTYQWQRCPDTTGRACTAIRKAAAATYVVSPADVGLALRVVVTATSRSRSAQMASTAVPVDA